ncbi:TolC family protein [Butyricimonas paravirosa]|uniref:TolC family protein n=1 Tax=Butyricimonas paravirosa TaxID=1472417 RepID=UPI00210AD25D|nr:TolC family protein [Butyricimonas paravirosa]MCQ4875351.1 TolC family protein [Butyricimonas paravirosa]
MKKKLILLSVGWLVCSSVVGQNLVMGKMSLEEAIKLAHTRSPQAQMVQLSFMSQYWSFRSYKAQLLPSLNLSGDLGNYNRSLVDVRDPETGRISYVANNTLSNDLSIYINQKIALTGGNVSLNTSLARLDQFSYDTKTYNSNPVTINYTQPLRSFNTLKWQKKTEPLQYEKAKKQYLESLEDITLQTTSYFFSVLSAQTSYRKSEDNLKDTRSMYKIAQQRYDIGTVTKSELLQLELSLMNAELTVSNSKVDLEVALFNFKSFLGVSEGTFFELLPPMIAPEVSMTYDFVLNKALQNSTHSIALKIKEINSMKSVAQAKADRGIQVELRANLGFSQTGDDLQGVYSRLKDREVVGLSITMPIYDWGMSRGRVKMAEAEARLARTELEQEETKFQQDIRIKVMQFNNQATQCNISAKALQIAEERYDITKKRFQNGGSTVTDLNTAQKELDSASEQYINQLRTFWNAYFELRKLSLYDFIAKKDISAEFDKIVEK